MEIRIDTERDSKADIRKIIKFLQSLVEGEDFKLPLVHDANFSGNSQNHRIERRISGFERSQEMDKLHKENYDSAVSYSSSEPASNEGLFNIFDNSKSNKSANSENACINSSSKMSGSSAASILNSTDFIDEDDDFDFDKKKIIFPKKEK